MRQVVLNILIAFLWVLFQDEDSFQFLYLRIWLHHWFNSNLYITSFLWASFLS